MLHCVSSIGLLNEELHPLVCQAILALWGAISAVGQALDEGNWCPSDCFDDARTVCNAKPLLLILCKRTKVLCE